VVIVVAIVAWYVAPAILGAFGAPASITATGSAATAGGLAAQGAVAGSIVGGFSSAINGGDLGDVLRGAALGAAQGAIAGGLLHGWAPETAGFDLATAQHVAGHGVLGGAVNVAMGGKFQDGFLSAAVSAGAGDFGLVKGSVTQKAITSAIIGGTASVLGGGKFANGAFTAAFQYLTNDAAAEYRERLLNSKICIQCHGVSARGFSGNVNDWELGTILSPDAEAELHYFANFSKSEAQFWSQAAIEGMVTYTAGGVVLKGAGIVLNATGRAAFLSERFGVTSVRFGNSKFGGSGGTWNRAGSNFKVGWSRGTLNGEYGMAFRIGIGKNALRPNVAKIHIQVPKTFAPNSTVDTTVDLKQWLFKSGQ